MLFGLRRRADHERAVGGKAFAVKRSTHVLLQRSLPPFGPSPAEGKAYFDAMRNAPKEEALASKIEPMLEEVMRRIEQQAIPISNARRRKNDGSRLTPTEWNRSDSLYSSTDKISSSARRSVSTSDAMIHCASAANNASRTGAWLFSTFLPEDRATPIEADNAVVAFASSPTRPPSETDRDGSKPTSVGGIRPPAPPLDFVFDSDEFAAAVESRILGLLRIDEREPHLLSFAKKVAVSVISRGGVVARLRKSQCGTMQQ